MIQYFISESGGPSTQVQEWLEVLQGGLPE